MPTQSGRTPTAEAKGKVPLPPKEMPETDVKPSAPSSEGAPEAAQTEVADSIAKDLDDGDLKEIEEQGKVPYARFREKVQEAKAFKNQLSEALRRFEDDKRRAVEDAEARVLARSAAASKTEEADLDPYEAKIRGTQDEIRQLAGQLSELRIQNEQARLQQDIARLTERYPEADPQAVLGWKKVRPAEELETLMEHSHTQNMERVERKLKAILEHKKAKAKSAVPTQEGAVRLKESERPKNLDDARALMRKYFGV